MEIQQKRAIHYIPMGEQILIVQLDNVLSIENNQAIQLLAEIIKAEKIKGVKEVITSISNLTILYDPLLITFDRLKDKLETLQTSDSNNKQVPNKTVFIPVVFDKQHGPDLEEISFKTGFSINEIVEIICSKPYYVYMIGFIAGLPYMGDLDKSLRFPRKPNPRLKVPKGSVAIANQMTDIYTIESPGGWHLVGWTPTDIFNIKQDPPNLLSPGDYVKYEPISADLARNWNDQLQKEWDLIWNI